jgi:hypothetical protein
MNWKQYERKSQADKIRINKNSKVTHVYIRKNGYYYCSDFCGYTEYQEKAGVYTKQEAFNHCTGITELAMVPIDVREHNAHIVKMATAIMKNYIH